MRSNSLDTPAASSAYAAENDQAEQHIEAGELPQAARILVDIAQKDPGNYRAMSNMGIIAWMQKAWHDSWDMFTKAASLKPDYSDALVNLFDAALKLRRIKEAYPYFEKALEVNPAMEEVIIIRDAIKDQGDEIYSSERGLMIGTYHPVIEEANKLVEDGKLYEAMEKYMNVVDSEGANAETYCGLGIISYYHQRYEDAFSLFLESVKLNPAKSDTFLNLLDAAKMCGKLETARKIFEVYKKELPSLELLAEDFAQA